MSRQYLVIACVLGLLACTAILPTSMIVLGVLLIRRAESSAASTKPANDLEESLAETTELTPDLAAGHDPLTRIQLLDLNRLNWIGWALLLGSFLFVLGEAGVVVLVVGNVGFARWQLKLVAIPLLILAVGFFVGTRWLLAQLGISIYRRDME